MATATYEPTIWNFKLLAHHELAGFGGMGEGMSIQIAKDGRRIIWLAHESAPKNFTGVDVTDPRDAEDRGADRPAGQASCAPTRWRRSATSWRSRISARSSGQKPAGFELFDISVPETPKSIAFVDRSGPGSRGVHQLWFCDGDYVHMAAGAPDFEANNPLDDQFYRIFDVRNPSKPVEVGRWWMPGTRQGDDGTAARAPSKRHATTWASARTTPTSIRSGPTAAISAISMAACSSWTSPTSRTRSRSAAGTTRRPITASPTPCCRCSSASCWLSPTSRWWMTPRTGRS